MECLLFPEVMAQHLSKILIFGNKMNEKLSLPFDLFLRHHKAHGLETQSISYKWNWRNGSFRIFSITTDLSIRLRFVLWRR